MITLFTFGPAFGLPDPSPFVMKAMILLKLAGLEYETDPGGFNKAPKGKLPYIRDTDGTIVADSALIQQHLQERYNIDFFPGLSAADKAVALAFERLCEDHLYWAVVHSRWMNDRNFNAGPRGFFKAIPAFLRPLIISKVRRDIRRNLYGQGLGRHTDQELSSLAVADVHALSDFLADKPFLMGEAPCGSDASVASFVSGLLCDRFESPMLDAARARPNLTAYRDRCLARWFTEADLKR